MVPLIPIPLIPIQGLPGKTVHAVPGEKAPEEVLILHLRREVLAVAVEAAAVAVVVDRHQVPDQAAEEINQHQGLI
jgi:hypothetical protein